jgi:hypothetical protein
MRSVMIYTYPSRKIITVIRSRMRWAVNVARVWKKTNAYKVLVGKQEGKNRFENLSVDGKIIFKWILKKQDGRAWIATIWLMISGRPL